MATERTTGISGANLDAGLRVLGDEIDLSGSTHTRAKFYLSMNFASAPAANKTIHLLLMMEDGAGNYEDGGTTGTINPVKQRSGVFIMRNTNGDQKQAIFDVIVPQAKLKCLLRSALTVNATAVTLKMHTY